MKTIYAVAIVLICLIIGAVFGFYSKGDSYFASVMNSIYEPDISEPFLNSREPTNSWEPSSTDFQKLGADEIYKSYAEDLKANVSSSIVESHNEYVKDTNYLATAGASHQSTLDSFNPPVQFHGLPRSAHYRNVGSENSSRITQSETPVDVYDISEHNATEYLL